VPDGGYVLAQVHDLCDRRGQGGADRKAQLENERDLLRPAYQIAREDYPRDPRDNGVLERRPSIRPIRPRISCRVIQNRLRRSLPCMYVS
jgi:hypothetical protein